MKTSDLDFDFPEKLTAQKPLNNRDDSRLLVVNRDKKDFVHAYIKNITDYLVKGDLLVVNDSKVLPARLFGKRKTGGEHEILLVKKLEQNNRWEAIAGNSKKIKPDCEIVFENGLSARCVEKKNDRIILEFNLLGDDFYSMLNSIGRMPLPPYIKRESDEDDIHRYQTVYANNIGSVAAPTAGFHFTENLIKKIKKKGINIASVTLHVSLDTFLPVREENIEEHAIHGERIIVSEETANIINKTLESGNRIIVVGTTSVRAIESCFDSRLKQAVACDKETKLFITEGYKFNLVSAMITNFHRPKSTLLALVSAFAGHDLIMSAYESAIKNEYRLFSYGDSMLIL